LAEGEQVVVAGQQNLADGAKVRVQAAGAPPAKPRETIKVTDQRLADTSIKTSIRHHARACFVVLVVRT
jgi:hypothetical protein